MTTRFRKKVRKYRGLTYHGGGAKKKRRGKGSRGGRGFAGMHKHKFSLVTTKMPEWYGKKGFYSHIKKDRTININEAVKLAEGNEINLAKLGYSKLLSKGRPDKAYTIKVGSYSSKAKEKIESSGGKIVSEWAKEASEQEKKSAG